MGSSLRAGCLTLAVVSAAALVTAGCGDDDPSGSPGGGEQGQVIESQDWTATKGPWLKWNKDDCRFVTASNHPETYRAELRQQDGPLKVAYTPFDTKLEISALINGSMRDAAERAGIEIFEFSNDYPSTSRPILAARQAAVVRPDVVISANAVAELNPQIQPIYEKDCIPMVNMFDFPVPNPAPGFQSGFVTAGEVMAEASIEIIEKRQWPADQIWVVICADRAAGPGKGSLLDVVTTFRDRVREAFDIPDERVAPILVCPIGQGGLGSRTAVVDWLTAHPDAKYVLGAHWIDTESIGMAQGLESKGFSDNALVAGQDGSDPAIKVIADGDPIFQVDADKNFIKWGIYGMSIAQDVAAGRPVPEYMDPGTVAITPDNAAQVLADRKKFLASVDKAKK